MGTPAATTRGMKEKEMIEIAEYIDNAIKQENLEVTKEAVKELANAYPPPM